MAIRFKGAHFSKEVILMGGPLVCVVSAEHASCRRTHGGTWAPSQKGVLPVRARSLLRRR